MTESSRRGRVVTMLVDSRGQRWRAVVRVAMSRLNAQSRSTNSSWIVDERSTRTTQSTLLANSSLVIGDWRTSIEPLRPIAVPSHLCTFTSIHWLDTAYSYWKVKVSHTRYRAFDPGVQAVSPQVTISHHSAVGCHYFPPGLRLPSQLQSTTALGQYQVILLGDRGI